ncbi:hypothetical protein PoB_002522600 [Plakobranchus ocellatus]|uniref:Uncharacterized protein n=1 Tax=Plakobranchus ocellatus TaxID=259542 RepID=A0AAV3ZHW0_9GAST|nr:hypothetical protein PoB_002522600 [Plakobranchus ocellatus]
MRFSFKLYKESLVDGLINEYMTEAELTVHRLACPERGKAPPGRQAEAFPRECLTAKHLIVFTHQMITAASIAVQLKPRNAQVLSVLIVGILLICTLAYALRLITKAGKD